MQSALTEEIKLSDKTLLLEWMNAGIYPPKSTPDLLIV